MDSTDGNGSQMVDPTTDDDPQIVDLTSDDDSQLMTRRLSNDRSNNRGKPLLSQQNDAVKSSIVDLRIEFETAVAAVPKR